MIATFSKYYHTLRFLRAHQITARLAGVLPRTIRPALTAPPVRTQSAPILGIPKEGISDDFDTFCFLNLSGRLAECGWDHQDMPRLWRYNLHYFDVLRQKSSRSAGKEEALALIERWIDDNPMGVGTGWEPYPASLRIVNWIRWDRETGALTERSRISLWNQVRWLAARPEYHLYGNHLLANAKALAFASAYFDLPASFGVVKLAKKLLQQEIQEQFLDDGAHFELSPMYHGLMMEDLLDLAAIAEDFPGGMQSLRLSERIQKGFVWLDSMVYANGEYAHFNDSVSGIASSPDVLREYANRLGVQVQQGAKNGLVHHAESGYVVVRHAGLHLISDVGRVGPDYQPGHAHADTLSFELSADGNRLIVNSGTSTYEPGPDRSRQRGTAAHSTVCINGEDSSEVWASFRVARRARPVDVHIAASGEQGSFVWSASHTGYRRLKGRPSHHRTWTMKGRMLEVKDTITGSFVEAVSRLHLHPDVTVVQDQQTIRLAGPGGNLGQIRVTALPDAPALRIVPSTYHDKFGASLPATCLEIEVTAPSVITIEYNAS